jgi:signal transduction histidine kinase/ligand-binding sensor domain-containing protein
MQWLDAGTARAWRVAWAIVGLALGLAMAPAGATRVQLPLTTYGQANGLTSLSVVRLLDDHRHVLWAGTEQGLYRFDGIGFNQVDAGQGFHTSEVVSLTEDASGHLWAGTRAGLQRQDDDGQFRWVRPDGQPVLADRGQTLVGDGSGGMYVVSGHRLWRVTRRGDDGAWTAAPVPMQVPAPGSSTDPIAAVYRRGDDLWLGCGDAVCRIRHRTVTRFGAGQGVPADKWVGFLVAADGTLWVRGLRNVLVLPAGASTFAARGIPGAQGEVAATNIDIVQDRQGRILTRTATGLARWDGERWELFDTDNGLPGVGISALVADREGMVWAGTYGRGILYWSNADAIENWTAAQGLSDSLIWSITRDAAGTVWVAGEGGGEVMDPAAARAHRWPLTLPPPYQAHAVLPGDDGSVWYFLFDGRVVRYQPASGRTETVGVLPYLVRGAFRDRTGHFWAYTMGGLYAVDPRTGRVAQAAPDVIPSTMCSDMAEDPVGRLWLACNSGLYRRNVGGWQRVRVQPDDALGGYENVAVTPDGRLWLSSLQPGLLSGQASDEPALAMAPVADPLLAATRFYFLRADRRGRLWAGGGYGVDVLDSGRWTRLSSRDGLLWDESNHGAFHADADGSVWIGTPVGLTHVLKPDTLLAPRTLLPRVLAIRYGGQPVHAPAELPHSTGAALTLAFGVAGNSAGHPVHFRYRLSPLDTDWVDTPQREVRYASLPHGHYRFELQVVDENRRTTSQPVSLAFSVRPPWWLAPWALVLFAFAALALGAGAWRWRTRMLLAHARRLEGLVAERTVELEGALQARRRLLAHIGHDLRSPVSAVLDIVRRWRAGHAADAPRAIERQARAQLDLIDELLEFSRGELTDLELHVAPGYLHGFLHDVAEHGRLLAARQDNTLELHVDADVPPVVHADFRRLRQVLVNLLGNAAKYTTRGRILFSVGQAVSAEGDDVLRFAVEDTGIGVELPGDTALLEPFARGANVQETEGSGLGLAIVAQLLSRMGTQLQVGRIEQGTGSRFAFEVRLVPADESDLEPDLRPGVLQHALDGAGRTVLVAEPHAPLRDVLCDLLDGHGFDAVPIASPEQLLARLRQPHHVLLIEPAWKDTDATGLGAQVREAAPSTPVVAYTAVTDGSTHPWWGCRLLKPADGADIVAAVHRFAVPRRDTLPEPSPV